MLKKIRNMKLKSRLLLSYAVVIAICLSASVAALFLMNRIGDNLSSFYKNKLHSDGQCVDGQEGDAGGSGGYLKCRFGF